MEEFKPIKIVRQDNKRVDSKYRSGSVLKKEIIKQRGLICQECKLVFKEKYLELDHMFPICLGGGYEDELNLQLLCYKCHQEKTHKDIKIINIMKKLNIIQKGFINEWIAFLEIKEIEDLYFQLLQKFNKTQGRVNKYNEW